MTDPIEFPTTLKAPIYLDDKVPPSQLGKTAPPPLGEWITTPKCHPKKHQAQNPKDASEDILPSLTCFHV